ncbi:MAG TPA: cytosine permease [Mycobacteriales bacterium]
MTTAAASPTITAELREGSYGSQVLVVEPGGAGMVPEGERHGRPLDLLWTWISPNLEFATVFVGFIAIAFFGQSFLQAVAAIVVGTALGSITMGVLSSRGPRTGLPQMIISRVSFGRLGNVLPAGLNTVTAGVGWFAVNSVSGALALAALTHLPKLLSLLIVVVLMMTIAFFGHNLIQTFERYVVPVLGVIFVVAAVIILSKAHPGSVHQQGGTGGFLLTVGAAFGYAAGWNPYASDYTRYLPASSNTRLTGLFAGLGIFLSCVLLETVGAALLTIKGIDPFGANPTGEFAGQLGGWRDLTLLAIALGSIAANVLNVYSGAMSFLAVGIELPLRLRRAIAAVTFGVIGAILAATSLNAPDRYENFLLIIAYWIGPWLGVFLTDQLLRRGRDVGGLPFDRRHNPFAGAVAMATGMAVSITLFSNQTKFQGFVARHHPGLGDIAFEVGFVVAAVVYAVLFFVERQQSVEEAVIVPDAVDTPA